MADEMSRINKLEERLNQHISDSNERDISILSTMARFESFMETLPDTVTNKIMERLDEKYVSKEHAQNLISKEREKSNRLYLANDFAESKWNECYEKHEDKVLDRVSKKIRISTGIYSLIGTIVGIIVGLIVKFSSLLNTLI